MITDTQVEARGPSGVERSALFLLLSLLFVPSPSLAAMNAATSFTPFRGLFSAPIVDDPDTDLPATPTIEEQRVAGEKSMERLRNSDQTLDANYDLVVYFNDLARRLLAAQEIKPPFPIVVHVSTEPQVNAYARLRGHIVVYNRIFEEADNEAQLAAILAHELSHEIHNDTAFFWTAAKNQEDSYGKNGLLEKSREIESRADLEATRMMYGAGWDPAEQIKMMVRIAKIGRTARDNHRIFYSTHPDDPERIDAIKTFVATLPPKPNLAVDSRKFHDLKNAM